MQALILVGGLGTRLRPLTNNIPKPMVEVHGRTFLEYQFDWLKKQGITDIILLTGHMADKFKSYYEDGKAFGVSISYTGTTEPLGTAGQIKPAENMIHGPFILINGDTYFPVDLHKLTKFHKDNGAQVTIALTEIENTTGKGLVVTNSVGKITKFLEKDNHIPGVNTINGGVYVVEPSVVAMIQQGISSLEKDIFPQLTSIYGLLCKEYFVDIGSHDTYAQFIKDMDKVKIK